MMLRSRGLSALLVLSLTLWTSGCSGRKATTETVTTKPEPADDSGAFDVASQDSGDILAGDLPMGDAVPEVSRYQQPTLRREISPAESAGMAASVGESLPPEVLALLEDIHFEFDSYRLSPEAREQLVGLGAYLRENRGDSLLIEGHCDERGDASYNMALGEKRALTVREFLAGTRVEANRMVTVSYGEERPINPGHNEAAWAENRCARFRLRRR